MGGSLNTLFHSFIYSGDLVLAFKVIIKDIIKYNKKYIPLKITASTTIKICLY
jgi:hypothetical protein